MKSKYLHAVIYLDFVFNKEKEFGVVWLVGVCAVWHKFNAN
jgi:hypothetical protein